MKITIGSLRQPKIAAVKTAFSKIQQTFSLQIQQVEFIPKNCESGISAMPLSLQQLMQGAYNRVQNLKAYYQDSTENPDFYVGQEGGFFSQLSPSGDSIYFLQGWVFVSDGKRGYFGASPAVSVPSAIVDDVVKAGKELGEVIDHYGKEADIRDKDGAFGVFTNGSLTRSASFEAALLSAFSPFFNKGLYAS